MAFCISLSFQLYTCYLLIASNVEKSTEYASNQDIQICNLKCKFSTFQASSPPITRETCVLWGKEQEALIRIPECGRISSQLCGLQSTLLQWTFGHFSASTRHKPECWTACHCRCCHSSLRQQHTHLCHLQNFQSNQLTSIWAQICPRHPWTCEIIQIFSIKICLRKQQENLTFCTFYISLAETFEL